MNTKEIIAYVRTNTVTNFSDVADALMADAKKLIEVRKCHTHEAKKSCYEEQITKYRSAFAKARPEMEAHGWTEDAMSNYFKSHKDSKATMAPPPIQEYRHTHSQLRRDQASFADLLWFVHHQRMATELLHKQNFEKAINDLEAFMFKVFGEFMEHCKKDPSISQDECLKIATRGMLQYISEKMWPGMNITDMSDRMDYVGMYATAYAQLRKNKLPELEELFEDKIQVLGFMTKYVRGFVPEVTAP